MDSLDALIQSTARWHTGQVRDGDSPLPYIAHPLEVLGYVRHIGGVTDSDTLATAILHDTLEHTSATPNDIENLAGPRVLALVKELTREEPSKSATEAMTKEQIWELRSRMMLKEIASMSPSAQIVKLADRLSNIQEAKRVKKGSKLARYRRQTEEILKTIPRKVNPPLWDAVKREID